MRVVLHVVAGPSRGRQIPLQAGEIARFGRSDFADVCFPADTHMAEVHFQLHCRHDGCSIRDLSGAPGTLLNDQPVTDAGFADGDTITAGQTTLRVALEGRFDHVPPDDDAPNNAAPASDADAPAAKRSARSATELCEPLDLDEAATRLLSPDQSPEAYLDLLVENGLYADALRVLAVHLPSLQSVFWGYHCFRQSVPAAGDATQQAVLDAVDDWLAAPDETHRRQAFAAAEASEFSSPIAWVALGVFWSGDSLAPPDLPAVTPEPHLYGQGVAAALMMLATQGDPTRAAERFERIIAEGRRVLSGELSFQPAQHARQA